MFGRNDDGPTQAPPAREPAPHEQFAAAVPPTRTFKVTRFKVTEPREENDPPVFETLYIEAHAIGVSDDDRTVFQQWRFNYLAGPHLEVVRMLTGVIEAEEMTVQAAGSGLLA